MNNERNPLILPARTRSQYKALSAAAVERRNDRNANVPTGRAARGGRRGRIGSNAAARQIGSPQPQINTPQNINAQTAANPQQIENAPLSAARPLTRSQYRALANRDVAVVSQQTPTASTTQSQAAAADFQTPVARPRRQNRAVLISCEVRNLAARLQILQSAGAADRQHAAARTRAQQRVLGNERETTPAANVQHDA